MSLFVSDTIGLFYERVLLIGGVRYQKLHVENYSYIDGSLNSTYDEDAWTPVIGIIVQPTDRISLFANRIEGLQQGLTAPNDPILTNPNEVFPPFKSVQYEFGGKAQLGPVFASLALYRIELPSAYSVLVDPNDPAGP